MPSSSMDDMPKARPDAANIMPTPIWKQRTAVNATYYTKHMQLHTETRLEGVRRVNLLQGVLGSLGVVCQLHTRKKA